MSCPACGAARARPSHLGEGRFETFSYRYLTCSDCGSLYADPMPPPVVLARIYSTEYVGTHYAAELKGETSSAELAGECRAAVATLALEKSGGRVLDVGCGAGRFLSQAHSAGLRAEGHELTQDAAAAAALASGLNVHSGPLSAIGQKYDAIHLADVLEHSPDPLALLCDATKLLEAGGVLLARGPLENQLNVFQLALKLKRLASRAPTEMAPYHVILFTLAGWRQLLVRARLEIVSERVYEIHWPAPEQFQPRPISLTKSVSLLVSASPIGKALRLGNRVVTLARSMQ
jgi:SAM-dependent methyltransferase